MSFFERLSAFFGALKPAYALEFVFLALIFYFVLNVLRNNNAKTIIVVFVLYTLITDMLCYFTRMPDYFSWLFP